MPGTSSGVNDTATANVREGEKVKSLASIRDVYSFGEGKFWLVACGLACSAVTGCVFPAMVFVYANAFQAIGGSSSQAEFLDGARGVAYSMMVLGAIASVFMTAQTTLLESAAGIMTRDMKRKWFRTLLRQDMAFYDIEDVSGTAALITSNGHKYRKGTGRKMGEMVQFTFTLVGGVAYAFYSSWQATLITLTVIPFMSLSAFFLIKVTTTQSARASETYAEAGGIVYNTVSAIKTILSLNAVQRMITRYTTATQKTLDGAAGLASWIGLANGAMMGSFLLSYCAIALYGSFLLYDAVRGSGCDPSGAVPGANYCVPRGAEVFGALMGMTMAAGVLPQVSVSVEAINGARAACFPAVATMTSEVGSDDLGDTERENLARRPGEHASLPKYAIDSLSEQGLKPESVQGELVFDNVCFSYPSRTETKVFNGLSLRIAPGKTVAIVGASGSGKSTTVQLIERFYDPTSGSLTLDGNDLRTLNVKWLRSQIGLVGQEPALFARSIRENIRYGKPDATQEEIESAARNAYCHDFISAFPDGYDTQVGDKGAQLSGGQKQRIAIARVLIMQPKILLLDEATSALDSESEGIVQGALDRLLQASERTTVVIAHRLSTVKNADVICVIHEGKVAETGTHDQLVAKNGHYCALVEAQKRRKKAGGTETDSKLPIITESMDVPETAVSTIVADGERPVLMRFRDVHFRYPSRPENKVFSGLNLTIFDGETLALVGPSGHGKSTIIQLIERFYDPTRGVVEMHGTDLKDVNVAYLRNKVGLVSQEPTLFDASIGDNIRYGKPDATQTEIEAAARRANMHDSIMDFPEKYETSVGAGGIQMSGGQKQRIAIARALIKQPDILLLDEATSALDTANEKLVQAALDEIMHSKAQTTVVIAHRLSTIRNADRIAVIEGGRVSEIGTHVELMKNALGRYSRLQMLQDIDTNHETMAQLHETATSHAMTIARDSRITSVSSKLENVFEELDKERVTKNAKRAWAMGTEDGGYFFVGAIGACMTGLIFPAWGFIFASMIELLYKPINVCENDVIQLPPGVSLPYDTCQEYWNASADSMRETSFRVAFGYIGTIAAAMIGNMLLFHGFNIASERMNKRVRDAAFASLVRQEVTYFDLHPVADLASRLEDDAALLKAFSGEPIRTIVMNTASVVVGLIVSLIYMWPFALVALCILPFMAFGAVMEMKMYMGEDEKAEDDDEHSSGAIVVETLTNIRTVASLSAEQERLQEFDTSLIAEDPNTLRGNAIKGSGSGLGQFFQMWGIALLFWWGGYLLVNYPDSFDFRAFLISMFSLLFSLSALGIAAQGVTDRDKAKLAAERIFELTDRESRIDPLCDDGKKDV